MSTQPPPYEPNWNMPQSDPLTGSEAGFETGAGQVPPNFNPQTQNFSGWGQSGPSQAETSGQYQVEQSGNPLGPDQPTTSSFEAPAVPMETPGQPGVSGQFEQPTSGWETLAQPGVVTGMKQKKSRKKSRKVRKSTSGVNKTRLRRILFASLTILALGLYGFGVFSGWTLHSQLQSRQKSSAPEIVEVNTSEEQQTQTVPDVRFLRLADAKQALADLGLDVASIEVKQMPWAGPAEIVVAQDPVVGEKLGEKLTLTVSEPAKVPNLIGKPASDAITEIRSLGSEPTIVEVFSPDHTTDTVLETVPAQGELLPAKIEVKVAQAGSSLNLSSVPDADGGNRSCSTSKVSIAGTTYPSAMECSASSYSESTHAWTLAQHASVFSAGFGLSDKSESGASAKVRILTDGQEKSSFTLTPGTLVPVNLPMAGVRRLDIMISSESGSYVYLADAIVKGTDKEIDELEALK